MTLIGRTILAWTLVLSTFATSIQAQLSAPLRPKKEFEAAAVKRNYIPTLFQWPRTRVEAHRFTATNATLKMLVQTAYEPSVDAQIAGGPDWFDTAEFDIIATAPGSSKADVRLMLRQLLADRFSMAATIETRTLPVLRMLRVDPKRAVPLGLTSSGCGPARSDDDETTLCSTVGMGNGYVVTRGITMARLAALLPRLPGTGIDRVVVDETGLSDVYAFTLKFAPTHQLLGLRFEQPNSDLPSFPTAIREQLGLKLEPGRAPVEVVVIDRATLPTPD